jgi:hypothetical protein
MSNSVIRFINGSTPSTVGTLRMVMNSTGLQIGNGSTAPGCSLDANGTIRSIGNNNPSTGTGIEINYDSANSKSNIFSYDRGTGSYKDLNLNDKAYLTSGGRFGIGTTSPNCPLHVQGTANQSTASGFGFLASSGAGTASGFTNRAFSIYSSGGILCASGEIDVLSDLRIKMNVISIDSDIVSRFLKVDPIKFAYLNAPHREHLGFAAQDFVRQGLPQLVGFTNVDDDQELPEEDIHCFDGSIVHLSKDQRLVVNLQESIPILHKALQLQQERLDKQQKQIDTLLELLRVKKRSAKKQKKPIRL